MLETDLDEALADPGFPSTSTRRRRRRACLRCGRIAAGKHVYARSRRVDPTSALDLARSARKRASSTGWCRTSSSCRADQAPPAHRDAASSAASCRSAANSDIGCSRAPSRAQRPSWNYRAEDGGGIVLDMFCHWRYVLDHLFGTGAVGLRAERDPPPERVDERGRRTPPPPMTPPTRRSSSRAARSPRSTLPGHARLPRDLLELQVDGTEGSAVAGLRDCRTQPAVATPRAVWNPDRPPRSTTASGLADDADGRVFENGFKAQWELFLRHVAGEPFPWTSGGCPGDPAWRARLRSSRERRWLTCRSWCCEAHRPASAATTASWSLHARGAGPLRPASRSPPSSRGAGRGPRCRGSAEPTPAAVASTGTRRSRSGATCGPRAWESPRRWTPRSVAGP